MVDLVQVLPVYLLLALQLCPLALLDQVLLYRQVPPPPLGDDPADPVDLRPVGQLRVLQLLPLALGLLLDDVEVALLDVRLVVEPAGHVFCDAAELLPRQAALQRLVQRLYLLLPHYLHVDRLVVLALLVGEGRARLRVGLELGQRLCAPEVV